MSFNINRTGKNRYPSHSEWLIVDIIFTTCVIAYAFHSGTRSSINTVRSNGMAGYVDDTAVSSDLMLHNIL